MPCLEKPNENRKTYTLDNTIAKFSSATRPWFSSALLHEYLAAKQIRDLSLSLGKDYRGQLRTIDESFENSIFEIAMMSWTFELKYYNEMLSLRQHFTYFSFHFINPWTIVRPSLFESNKDNFEIKVKCEEKRANIECNFIARDENDG